jgi:DNA-binding CsgD family transcriptional regulator
MSLPSEKNNSIGGDNNDFIRNRPLVRIMDDKQWRFVRKSFRMSPRELDVAKLVCSGLSNEEISFQLDIKVATVKTHLRNVYRRIRVQRKLDMLLMFLEQGSKYTRSASDINISAVIKNTSNDSGLRTEIGGQDQIAGH